MGDITELKGLNDLRTATTTHLHSIPHHEGTEYLELYLASNEKKRLAKLTKTWERQQRRTQARRAAVIQSIAKLEKKVGLENNIGPDPLAEPVAGDWQPPAPDYTRRRWKKMTVDY